MRLASILILIAASASAASKPASDELVNLAALDAGARELDEEGNVGSSTAGAFDGRFEKDWDLSASAPHAFVLELAEPGDIEKIVVVNSNQEEAWPGLSVQKLEIETGASRKGPWKPLLSTKLKKGTAPQAFPAKASGVRYLRVAVANYGNPDWTALGELQVMGRRSKARTVDFTGAWETSYGELKLTQKGGRVTGCYGAAESKAGNHTVQGTVEGPIFFGIWHESVGEGEGTQGTMAFALTPEGNIAGAWGSNPDGSDRTGRWDGERLKKSTITCEDPDKDLSRQLEQTGRVVLRGILFDTGKDVIKPESIPVLEALAKAMQETDRRYLVEGHTDDRGGADYNRKLSEKRASSVKAWLAAHGVPAERLDTKGFGLSKPSMPNGTEAGRAANRRVEVAVAD